METIRHGNPYLEEGLKDLCTSTLAEPVEGIVITGTRCRRRDQLYSYSEHGTLTCNYGAYEVESQVEVRQRRPSEQ